MGAKERNSFKLKVWGEYACFTRPEMKAERMSYEVMTPSAARNILQSIMWKPAIDWHVYRIDVCKPIQWVSIRRNEVSSKIPVTNAIQASKDPSVDLSLYIEDERQQRAGLFLRDVEYVIHAYFEMTSRAGSADNETKFRETFERRAKKGQCFMQPYLGCREFSAFFSLLSDENELPRPISESRELGLMLHDIEYQNQNVPRFFAATLSQGVMNIPQGAIKV